MRNGELTRTKLIIVAVVASLLVIAALSVFTVKNKKRIQNQNAEYLLDSAIYTAVGLDDEISAGYDNIKILSELVNNSLTGPEFDISSIQELINNSVFDFMEFADKDGMDHNITGGVSDATDRKYYLDAKEGNTGMELIYVSRATHETLLMFYSPIYYEKEFVGSLVGVYQASNRITNMLPNEYFSEESISYLATEEGRIIACSGGFDPRNEMYIYDLAGKNEELKDAMASSLKTGEKLNFPLGKNDTGGCMVRLPESGMYLIVIFPEAASRHMIFNANKLAYGLVAFLLLICVLVQILLGAFFTLQHKQVENAKNQAELANKAKTDFLFNMSHDIRTPMNAIIGFNRMALKNIDNREKVKECLNKSSSAGNMLLSLINSILDMSRIESGNAVLEEKQADVLESFKNVEITMQVLARSKDIRLSFEYGNIEDRYVYIDYDRTTRIFTNIISNAIKYSHKGGHVRVSCEQIDRTPEGYGLYRYVFEDDGIGMSSEFQKHVFDEFSREENDTVNNVQGTGLGLAVVKSFVELMQGTIECVSKQGEGTTFIVVLPFRLQSFVTEEVTTENGNDNESIFIDADNFEEYINRFVGKRTLLCEDNELNREIAIDFLEEEGFVVEYAVNGKEAVQMIGDKGIGYYDFILMDINMPVMNGYEATREIRRLYPDIKAPIIALSANAFAEDIEASLEAGMNAHVAKPIVIDDLIRALAKYI